MENTKRDLESLGVEKVCGSVIGKRLQSPDWAYIRRLNDKALELRERYNGFYVPGFHVNPHFVKESIEEVERMHKLGVKLVGELVPYHHCWTDYSCKEFSEILEVIDHYGMVVSLHSHTNYVEECVKQMDEVVKNHPNVKFVGAHICDGALFDSHLSRMIDNGNYYVDLSGGGISRHGVLKHLVDECGADRILFGSDYPICNPSMYVGGVALEYLISEEDKKKIFYDNAVKLLGL
jgi:predicted TIM-barrel fold metal-dependent hydrolase